MSVSMSVSTITGKVVDVFGRNFLARHYSIWDWDKSIKLRAPCPSAVFRALHMRSRPRGGAELVRGRKQVKEMETSCARGDTICPPLSQWASQRLTRRRTDAT